MTAAVTVGYVGMTHLGLCSAISAASKGFSTVGFAPDRQLVDAINAGRLPVVEPELDDLLRANRERIGFVFEPTRLAQCDVIYVAPDIPTDDRGGSDLSPLIALLELA